MGDATAPKPQAAPRRVPVNKIEADLYVPEDYAYMGFSGTLHPRPSTDSNTLRWVQEFFAGQREQEVDRGETHGFQAPVLGGFVTQGRLFRFQTLAPVATVSLTYCDRKLFSAFDLLVVLAVLLLAFYLTSERLRAKEPVSGGHARLPLPRLWVCVAFVLIPLCLGWFATSDAGELLRAWFWAGVLFSAFALVVWGRQRWRAWQELRLATAPDPFLEEAEGPPKPASGIDGQASSSTPTEASPGEEPEKAGEGGDEKKEDQK
jgi:hypothetical protein